MHLKTLAMWCFQHVFTMTEAFFFKDAMISWFATEITEGESSSVSGPVGSGSLTSCSPRFPTGFKEIRMLK